MDIQKYPANQDDPEHSNVVAGGVEQINARPPASFDPVCDSSGQLVLGLTGPVHPAVAALLSLVYQDGKAWYVGIQEDQDVADIVKPALQQAAYPPVATGRPKPWEPAAQPLSDLRRKLSAAGHPIYRCQICHEVLRVDPGPSGWAHAGIDGESNAGGNYNHGPVPEVAPPVEMHEPLTDEELVKKCRTMLTGNFTRRPVSMSDWLREVGLKPVAEPAPNDVGKLKGHAIPLPHPSAAELEALRAYILGPGGAEVPDDVSEFALNVIPDSFWQTALSGVPLSRAQGLAIARAVLNRAVETLHELLGQVLQARDGFGIWPYEGSTTMADVLKQASLPHLFPNKVEWVNRGLDSFLALISDPDPRHANLYQITDELFGISEDHGSQLFESDDSTVGDEEEHVPFGPAIPGHWCTERATGTQVADRLQAYLDDPAACQTYLDERALEYGL